MLVLYLSTISLEWKNIDSDLMQFHFQSTGNSIH